MSQSPLVIAALHDGLGNQLFQYAMGRALADRLGVPLKLDVTHCKHHPTRPYALDQLSIPAVEATQEEIRDLYRPPSRLRRRLQRAGFLARRRSRDTFFESRFYHFDPRVMELEAPVYVDGFWQSVRYFESVRARLLEEFCPRASVERPSAELLDRITTTEAVCVHVRRGDYVGHEEFRLLPIDYYQRAVAAISSRVTAPCFVVFSDDPEWTRAHLTLPEPVIWTFESKRHSALQDMQLMRACKHFIIANSSFSFWPAWLSNHPGKTVVRARQWFQNPTWGTDELRQSDWITL